MTTRGKRDALEKRIKELERKHTCCDPSDDWKTLCPFAGNKYCDEYTTAAAPSHIIDEWYELFCGEEGTIKDSGDRTEFQSGAVRDMHEGKGRFDLLPMCVLMRLAKHYEAGARKYAERNWERGIPCHSFADSAMRHLVKYMDGYTDEDHLIAAIWNLCGLAWTEEKKPELMDIPARKAASNG